MKLTEVTKFVIVVTLLGFPTLIWGQTSIGVNNNLLIPKFSYFSQTDHFDANGNTIKGLPAERFDIYIINIHYGYGITNNLDLVVDLPYLFEVSNTGNGKVVTNQGLGDAVIGVNYSLLKFKNGTSIAVQLLSVLPLYTNTSAATTLGLDEYGGEVNLTYFGALTNKIYFNTEVAFRKYFNDRGPDQLTLSGGINYYADPHNDFGVELSYFQSLSYSGRISLNKTFVNGIYVERDYGYLKPGINYSHQFSPKFSMSASTYYIPYGHNTGVAYSTRLSGIFKF